VAGNTVVVSVLADTKRFSDGFKDAGSKAGGLLKAVAPLAGAVAAAFSVRAIVQFGAQAVRLASDLEQSVGAVESVFKENASQITAWSKTAASAAGLTAAQYNTTATLIGTYLKSAGVPMDQLGEKTNDLVVRGADLAATFGGPVDKAVGAIGSALRGEFEPLRAYGVALSQAEINARALADSGKTNAASLTTQEKALATQALVFEKSADAAGQFARESNTLAGQQERLKALWGNISTTLGSVLLPALTAVTGAVAGFMQTVTASEGFQTFIDNATSFVTALFSGESALGGFGAQITALAGFFSPLGLVLKVIQPLLPQLMDGLSQVAGVIDGALGAVLPTVIGLLQQVVDVLSGALATVLPLLIPLIVQIAETFGTVLAAVLPVVAVLLGAVVQIIQSLLPALIPIIGVVLSVVQAFLPLVAVIGELVGAILPPLISILMAVLEPILALVAPLISLLAPAIQFVASVLSAIIQTVVQVITWLVQLVTGSETAAAQVRAVWEGILSFFAGIPAAIGGFFSEAGRWLVETGQNIINGLLNGLQSAIGAVWNFITDVGQNIADTFANVLGIHSPSRVFAALGRNVVQGLEQGLAASNSINSIMSNLGNQVAGSFHVQVGSLNAAPNSVNPGSVEPGQQINVNVVQNYPTTRDPIKTLKQDAEAVVSGIWM